MKGIKKILFTALVGIIGTSILTSPVFAAAGGAGADSGGTGNITVNYHSLTQSDTSIKNKVGPDGIIIDTDVGYAWDDLSFTYVQTIGEGESTLTTDTGYSETSAHFVSGSWYKGSYSTLAELDNALNGAKDISLPEISLIAASTPGADVSVNELAKLPKIVLHNYTAANVNYAFGVASDDLTNFNNNGMLTLVNENREACEVEEATGVLEQSSTRTYGVTPIGAPATKDFSPFNVNLTISIN